MDMALETIQEKVADNFNTQGDASFVRINIRIAQGSHGFITCEGFLRKKLQGKREKQNFIPEIAVHGFILDLLQGNVKKSYEGKESPFPLIEKVLGNSLAPFRFLTPFSIRSSWWPWGQALPPGEDTFQPLALMAFPEIRPDPDILAKKWGLAPFFSLEERIPKAKSSMVASAIFQNPFLSNWLSWNLRCLL